MSERSALIKPVVVNKVFGAGTYERWEEVRDAFNEELDRAYANEQRYSALRIPSLKKQLQADVAFAEKIHDDLLTFLERVSSSGTGNLAEGEKIVSVFVLAISVLT